MVCSNCFIQISLRCGEKIFGMYEAISTVSVCRESPKLFPHAFCNVDAKNFCSCRFREVPNKISCDLPALNCVVKSSRVALATQRMNFNSIWCYRKCVLLTCVQKSKLCLQQGSKIENLGSGTTVSQESLWIPHGAVCSQDMCLKRVAFPECYIVISGLREKFNFRSGCWDTFGWNLMTRRKNGMWFAVSVCWWMPSAFWHGHFLSELLVLRASKWLQCCQG